MSADVPGRYRVERYTVTSFPKSVTASHIAGGKPILAFDYLDLTAN